MTAFIELSTIKMEMQCVSVESINTLITNCRKLAEDVDAHVHKIDH